jgi:hypothetical protein
MSKKKPSEEQTPEQAAADEQAALEARIAEMMELDARKIPINKPKTKIKVTPIIADEQTEESDVPATAPELPIAKKAVSIKVIDHDENDDTDIEDKKNISKSSEPLSDENSEEADEQEPEVPPEVTAEIEAINQQLKEEVAEVGAEKAVSEDDDSEDDEPETEVAEEVKEKPLSHLDSIVPKSKVEETLENEKTDEIVEDIIASESDALMEAEDEKLAEAFRPEPKKSFGSKFIGLLRRKSVRRLIIFTAFVGLLVVGAFPSSRYFVLNTAGVRSAASLTVLDESTTQPLKNVTVKLGDKVATTDQEGHVRFIDVRLGTTELIVEKRAFATLSDQVVIGWGSNPLQDYSLKPTGTQYAFKITDFLSGKPIDKAEAVSLEANAQSNEQGEILLTIDQQDDSDREVVITSEGNREERFMLDLDQKEEKEIKVVPNRKQVFISKRSGRFDVYKIDIDGKNEKLVLPGTGSEREDMVLISHPTDEVAALVSTKDNRRNADGFLLSTLTIINLDEETTKSVATSERVQIIDWIGSRIVYVVVKEGASGNDPDRHKLISYDYKSGESKDLANSNYFNDVMVAGGKVYYAPSSAYINKNEAYFYRINSDGTDKKTILNQEVWNAFRTSYEKLSLASQDEWYELIIGETQAGKVSGEPPSQTSRVYVDSPDGTQSLWVDIRDGKGVLLDYDIAKKSDKIIRTQGGLKGPVRWLTNNIVIYRVNTESETADYSLSLDGGEPVKIQDVTNTSGINTWYYY